MFLISVRQCKHTEDWRNSWKTVHPPDGKNSAEMNPGATNTRTNIKGNN